MNQTEQQRAHVLTQVQHGTLQALEAASLLDLSLRHVRRLLSALRRRGLATFAHGNRGHPSPHRLAEAVRDRVLTLARTAYAGVNDHHLTELLQEREGIHLSRPTVQRLLRAAGIGSPRTRRPPRHRRRRARMPQAGLLIQMDGSHHPWLEDRGPRLVLHGAIDDATGEVLAGIFRELPPAPSPHPAVWPPRRGVHRSPRDLPSRPASLCPSRNNSAGRPSARRSAAPSRTWASAGSLPSRLRARAASSAFQDRLTTELRLAQARTLTEAQRVLDRFLPRYNARFAQPPADPTPAWRPAPPRRDLERICSFKYRRTVQNDNTVQLDGRVLQLQPGPHGRSYAGTRLDIHAHLDGTLAVYHRGQRLPITVLLHGLQRQHQSRPAQQDTTTPTRTGAQTCHQASQRPTILGAG